MKNCVIKYCWCAVFFVLIHSQGMAASLTLSQAESIAIATSPELRQLKAKSDALQQSAIAKGQLADPRLMVGAMNVPVDTFSFTQENMTQVQVGIEQSFPRGRTRHFRSLETRFLSAAKKEQAALMRLRILHEVRLNWLSLYYWQQAKSIVLSEKKIFRRLLKVTESLFVQNKAQQSDVIRSQLELAELDNRLVQMDQKIQTARAALARWVGKTNADKARPSHLPRWPTLTLSSFKKIIWHHPLLQSDKAIVSARHAGVHLAEQQYKPGLKLGVAYGFRQGLQENGRHRSDFLSAGMSMNLPLFLRNRQDRLLESSQDELVVSQEQQQSHYRSLNESLNTQYVIWMKQRKSSWLYRKYLVPEARQYAEASLISYRNNKMEFPNLARSYVRELNTRLGNLKVMVDRERARVNLLYLEGK